MADTRRRRRRAGAALLLAAAALAAAAPFATHGWSSERDLLWNLRHSNLVLHPAAEPPGTGIFSRAGRTADGRLWFLYEGLAPPPGVPSGLVVALVAGLAATGLGLLWSGRARPPD